MKFRPRFNEMLARPRVLMSDKEGPAYSGLPCGRFRPRVRSASSTGFMRTCRSSRPSRPSDYRSRSGCCVARCWLIPCDHDPGDGALWRFGCPRFRRVTPRRPSDTRSAQLESSGARHPEQDRSRWRSGDPEIGQCCVARRGAAEFSLPSEATSKPETGCSSGA